MKRSLQDYLVISLKGIAMGAADVVPGVSGGTIAFISGIYEELISTINNINASVLTTLKNKGISAAWKQINGNFLAALLLGIGISIASLAKGIKWLLENEPVLLWSFFFGLVLASILFVARQISKWRLTTIILFIVGTVFAYFITSLPPMQNTHSLWFLFIAGALAICAMILPGISGAFILVLLGAYKPVLEAIDERNFKLLGVVAVGAIFGILSFSRVLKWMFTHYKDLTLAILTGFILGSLNKIWPWKQTLSWYQNSKGIDVPLLQKSISPFAYDGDPKLMMAVILAVFGFLTIYLLEKLASGKS